jgi:3D (Asp-Asp-Asp) domain-containing protein
VKRILIIAILLILISKAQAVVTHVTLTCYQPVKSQCDNEPLTTADGSKINLKHLKAEKIKWCAISRDLLYLFPKGKPKKIYIEGYGVYEVRDVMNKRHTHRVDILIHPKDSKRISIKNVKIKIIS